MGNYDKAIASYLKSLKIYEELSNKTSSAEVIAGKRGMAVSYNNIGIVYWNQGSLDKASEYFLKSLKMNEELSHSANSAIAIGGQKGMSECYNNIGMIHYNQGSSASNPKIRSDNYEIALEYFLKSLKIKEEIGDKKAMAICIGNIGVIYKEQGHYDKAIEYSLKNLKLDEESGDKNGLTACYVNIGTLNITLADSTALGENQKLNYLNNAIKYGTKAIELAREIKAIPRENDAANALMTTYKKLGNFKKSLEFAEIFIATKDSMFREEKTKSLSEMETKYQSEKKQLEIDKLGKEKELQTSEMNKQRLIIWFTVLGLLFAVVFSVFLFRLFMQKKKANKLVNEKNVALHKANEEINAQKEEITVQHSLVVQQKERIEEQKKEITDSINYARRIQQAILPNMASLAGFEALQTESDALSLSKCEKVRQCESDALSLPKCENRHTFAPSRFHTFDYFVLFKPKDIVSGDFYWGTRINEWLIVTVADCTGHGVPGGFMSMLGVSFLNEIVRKKEITKASQVLDNLRESIVDALQQKGHSGEQKDGMDIALVAINMTPQPPKGGEVKSPLGDLGVMYDLQFAGANNPLYLVKNVSPLQEVKHLNEIKGDKQPVGIHEKMKPFTNHEIQLNKGDTLYLCSDGYEDQFGGPKGKKFLTKNLKKMLIENCEKPMNEQKDILDRTIEDWKNSYEIKYEQTDDVTVVGIKI